MDRTDDVIVEKIFEKFSKYFHRCDPFSVSSAFPWHETTGIRGVTDFPFPPHVHIHVSLPMKKISRYRSK